MSVTTEEQVPSIPNTLRPLPPDIKLNRASGLLRGTVEPGKIVKLTSSRHDLELSSQPDEDGNWHIHLGGPPEWFTIFHIWTHDPVTEATSHKVRHVVGGLCPTTHDVHVGLKTAFGFSGEGTNIIAYGPAGQILGQAFVFGKAGAWCIKFREELNDGDRVCLMATGFNGTTAMPLHLKANTFAVDRWNPVEIVGSGALPDDEIELVDTASEGLIGRTKATQTGLWSYKFEPSLPIDKQLSIRRVHADGSATDGPTVSIKTDHCQAPSIETVSNGTVHGMASSGLQVVCKQYRDSILLAEKTAVAKLPGLWSVTGFEFLDGDCILATTVSEDGTEASQTYASLTIGDERPGMPLVESIDTVSASGFGDPGDYIIATAANLGIIGWQKIGRDASWSLNWGPIPELQQDSVLIQFGVYSHLHGIGIEQPASCYAVRFADSLVAPPDPPAISGFDWPTMTFTGTEDTPNTQINVQDDYMNKVRLAYSPVDVQADNSWSLPIDIEPSSGDLVQAVAWALIPPNNSFGPNAYSGPYYVPVRP